MAHRRRAWPAAAIVLAVGLTVTASSTRAVAPRPAQFPVVFVVGDDRLPNRTASDWVTYADAVVVVTPSRQTDIGPDRVGRDRGEGLITRQLTLHVDAVLWTRPHAARAVPTSFGWTALGWLFHGDPADPVDRVEMAAPGTPRIELGHSYVVAVEREPRMCPPGEHRVPPRWLGLGGEATLPFDDRVLGFGEIAGRSPITRVALAPNDPNYSLADAVTGRGAPALVAALLSARPEKNDRTTYLPVSAPC